MGTAIAVIRIILVLAGAFFAIIGFAMFSFQRSKEKRCEYAVDAVVKKNAVICYQKGAPGLYHPVFEYMDGYKKATYQSSFGYTSPKFTPGEKVKLHLNPNDKKEFYVEEERSSRFMGITFLFVGLICVFVGVVMILMF